MNPDDIEFWDSRYRANQVPWDFHGIPPTLAQWLPTIPNPGRVLIPGCGSAYEVRLFAAHGWDVLAIDFSPAAVQRARAPLGPLGSNVILADFFTHPFPPAGFDLVYERTFLCALSPARWPDYARRISDLLKPRAKLAGFFLYGQEDDPPPYPITEPGIQSLLTPRFTRLTDNPVTDSLPAHAGRERWQVWERIPN